MTRNVYCSSLGIVIVSIIFGCIQGHPHRSLDEQQRSINREIPSTETIMSNRTRSQLPASRVRETKTEDHESRRTVATVSRVRQTLENDGKIVFPSDLPEQVPTKITIQPATECRNTTFCEYPTFYPDDLIKKAIKTRHDLQFLSTIDTVGPEIGQRIDGGDNDEADESLCAFEETVIFPKTGETKDKEWLYIVNEGNFRQGVRIEQCTTKGTACSLIEGFTSGYSTMCKQKYVYRQMASVVTNGSLGTDFFRFPASCCCHVKLTGNPLTSRLRISSDKATNQTPAQRTSDTSRETKKK